ncbi:MAG: DegV family protein [Lachnospiraceae bacterium]
MEYLKRGGRLTPGAAAIASVLNIKPLLTIQGEKIDSYAKMRGNKKCQKQLIKIMKEKSLDYLTQGRKLRIGITGSFSDEKDAKEWYLSAIQVFADAPLQYDPLTFSITCHTGPNAFGMGISTYPEELCI